MKKLLAMILFALSLASFADLTQALSAEITADGQKLVLNGEGLRKKFGLKLYKGGLYLKEKQKNANGNSIVAADQLMAIRMEVTSNLITEERLTEIVRDGFAASTGSRTVMKPEIDLLLGSFAKNIKNGDVCDLVYTPGLGTTVYKNGKKGNVIKGVEFKKALFGIWLGIHPAQQSLKDKMLGK